VNFLHPSMCEAHDLLVHYVFHISLLGWASPLVTCAIITSYTHRFHATFLQLTLVGCFECGCSYYVWAVWHSYKFKTPWSRSNVHAMTRGRPTAETPKASSYSWCLQSCLQLRMASRRAIEWIEHSKVQLVFKVWNITCDWHISLCPHWVRTGGWGGQNSLSCYVAGFYCWRRNP